jgi:hypothetical protein
VQALNGSDKGEFEEFVPQTAGVDWGELEEGSIGSETIDAGVFGAFDAGSLGGTAASSPGLAYLDRRDFSGTDRDRWLYMSDSSIGQVIFVVDSDTAFDVTTPTNDTTGDRSAATRVGDNSLADLVNDGIITGTALDLAVRPGTTGDEFDIYILADDSGVTKLFAIRATIPTSGDNLSFETIDLDPGSADSFIQLKDTVEDADIAGRGIVFSADGDTLYVASTLDLSTGNGGSAGTDDGRIYIFDVAAVPEPATMGLLALGGVGLLAVRRRRR